MMMRFALAWHMAGEAATASKLVADRAAAVREARALQAAGAVVRLVDSRGRVILEGTLK